jgi:arylsulfatase A-like enzyme
MRPRDLELGRDCYDDCIAYLDAQLGKLLNELKRQGVLENTLVIITSDHGEAFGAHGRFGHSSSVYLDEVAVPLVILSPDAPAGHSVDEAVSLRDVPATVADKLGLSGDSPFPGVSLAAQWTQNRDAEQPAAAPAFSEVLNAEAFNHQRKLDGGAVVMSVVAGGQHYLRDGLGREQLFDLRTDPTEKIDRLRAVDAERDLRECRKRLLQILGPGTSAVEKSYLAAFRRDLASLVPISQAMHGSGKQERAAPRPIARPSNAAALSARDARNRR